MHILRVTGAYRLRHWLAAAVMWALAVGAASAAGPPQSTCVQCHSYAVRGAWLNMVPQWKSSIHAAEGVGCNDCHGGNPRATDFKQAMYNVPGFTARWAKRDIPAMCARCHANPVRMRPYSIPTDQYSQYQQSVHGRRLLQAGDDNVAACTDCHGVHAIRAPDDPESSVFKVNVPKLCAGCHANKQLMAQYGLPTGQYDQYVRSVHGRKLLQQGDRMAPACPDCHGAHGATPPGVTEVPAVCGRCHARTEQEFNAGAHKVSLDASGKPRCVDCHGNHGIQLPRDAMLVGDARGQCGSCHGPGTKARSVGERVHGLITRTAEKDAAAVRLVDAAAAAHMDVGDLRVELGKPYTSLLEARAAQHAVAIAPVEDTTRKAMKVLDNVEREARQALADSRRHRDIVLVLAGLFVLGSAILWLKRWQVMAATFRGR